MAILRIEAEQSTKNSKDAKPRLNLARSDIFHTVINVSEPKLKTRMTCSETIHTIINAANHIFLLLLTGYVIYVTLDPFGSMNRHAVFCTIGYALLMAKPAIILAGEDEHGITGVTSVVIMVVTVLQGLPTLCAVRLRKSMKQVKIQPLIGKFCQKFLGISCFGMGMASRKLGYELSSLKQNGVSSAVIVVIVIPTMMITLFSLIGALRILSAQLLELCRQIDEKDQTHLRQLGHPRQTAD